MNGSLVPANTKKSLLVFGMFRPLPDLLILGGGVGLTIFLLLIFGNANTWILIGSCTTNTILSQYIMCNTKYIRFLQWKKKIYMEGLVYER